MDASADVIREGLTGPLEARGFDVEDVTVQRSGRRHVVRVIVDRDGGIDLDAVAEVSRMVGDLLENGPLAAAVPGPYVLEVSSPGVDRPLTDPRHWRRAAGRLVRVVMADGTEVVGRIVTPPEDVVSADGATVRMTVDGEVVELARASITRAVVQVEFDRKEADTAIDDSEGEAT